MVTITESIRERAANFVAPLDEPALERIARFLDLLIETNKTMNLVRFKDEAELWERHVFDSLSVLPWVDTIQGGAIVDLGSGGGFPGLPIALARPDRRVVLIEATQKKAAFLEETVKALGLEKVTVLANRAEDLGRNPSYRERYPLVVSRAVGRLSILLELALPLVAVGGTFLALKGERAEDELHGAKQALRLLGGEAAVEPQDELFPGRAACIVQVDKVRKSGLGYPRPAGIPERKPLG
jgi:16S rRNA (guanine527-N7)-methyltransferase